MLIAEVLGSVTAPEQVSNLRSHRLLVVRRIELDERGSESDATPSVAVDLVGAGPGDRVLVVTGSAARLTDQTRAVATDMAIVAIVDSIDLTEGARAHVSITKRTA